MNHIKSYQVFEGNNPEIADLFINLIDEGFIIDLFRGLNSGSFIPRKSLSNIVISIRNPKTQTSLSELNQYSEFGALIEVPTSNFTLVRFSGTKILSSTKISFNTSFTI